MFIDANILGHHLRSSSTAPGLTYAEGTLGTGLLYRLSKRFSLAILEGISAYSDEGAWNQAAGGNGHQVVNNVALELEIGLSDDFSVVARMSHRSGIFGTIDCGAATCHNEAYLLGVRYSFSASHQPVTVNSVPNQAREESTSAIHAHRNQLADHHAAPVAME